MLQNATRIAVQETTKVETIDSEDFDGLGMGKCDTRRWTPKYDSSSMLSPHHSIYYACIPHAAFYILFMLKVLIS